MKKASLGIVGIVLLLAGLVACTPPPPPTVTLEVTASQPDGAPISGVAVSVNGEAKGETKDDGKLNVPLAGPEPGTDLTVKASLERPGVKFTPVEQQVVVRRYDATKPETLRLPVALTMTAVEAVSEIAVESAGMPVAGAEIKLDGKKVGVSDAAGLYKVQLAPALSRQAKVAVSVKGYEDYTEDATLAGGSRVTVSLAKRGANAVVRVVQEKLGRWAAVDGAEVTVDGQRAGKTDASGAVKVVAPSKDAKVEVRKAGWQPEPAKARLAAGSASEVTVVLSPSSAPTYRIAVLPPTSSIIGDKELDDLLPEVEERLTDFLFAHSVFERVDPEALQKAMKASKLTTKKMLDSGWDGTALGPVADAVVATIVSKSEGDLVLSIRAVSVKGKTIAGLAEAGKATKVRLICEQATDKILEAFPFEGHVLEAQPGRLVTTLGKAGDRGVKRGGSMAVYRVAPGKGKGVSLTEVGQGKVKGVEDTRSEIEVAQTVKAQVGDKVSWVPPQTAATMDGLVTFTVKAGKEGTERAMGDVTVYRNGVWVGSTSPTGEIKVPVPTGQKVSFIFVRGGIPAHVEQLKIERGTDRLSVLMPAAMTRLKLDSEPSGAKVVVDGEDMGVTPLETDIFMGFHRVRVEPVAGDWRAFDKVLEFVSLEENLTGDKKIVLTKDVMKESEIRLARGDVDGAISILEAVQKDHPDFSQAHHRLAGIYLDEKKDADRAIQEFETVLSLPENRELVNKRFAVTFLNLGRAYYLQKGYDKAIADLTIARDNKRFFPRENHDRATHDTLYYLALSSHKLYYAQRSERVLQETAARWKDYFDFFPESLKEDEEVKTARSGSEHFYEEIKRKLGGE